MTIVTCSSVPSEDTDPDRADELAEFAALVARSSLGTPEALDNQRLGQDLREQHESRNVETPAIDAERLFAVAQHLQALELYGSAELTYRTAAAKGSTTAAAALADLLDRDGRVEEARGWYEQAWRQRDGKAGLRIAVEMWAPGRTDEAEKILDSVIADHQHEPNAHPGDITGAKLLVRDGNVRDALRAGWRHTGDDGFARAIMFRLARATMEALEVQYERIDPPPDRTSATPLEWDEFPPGSPLRWRPPGSPATYRLRARWRRDAVPSFVPEVIRSEILFVVANACFSAGGLINWGTYRVQDFLPTEDRHSMTVPRFFELVSRQCPPVDREVAGSLAELAELDVGIRIMRSLVLDAVGVKELLRQVAEKRVLGPRKEQVITRVRELADSGRIISLDNRTAPVARRVGSDVQQTRTVLAQVRQKYGETVRSMSDGHIQHLCAVRGPQNTFNLIDHVVRMSGGNESKLRELIQTVLGYLDVLLLFRASQPL
jgi:hypothetical protein